MKSLPLKTGFNMPYLVPSRREGWTNEFSGIEKRLDELRERLARLEQLRTKSRSDFEQDPYLRALPVGR